MTILYYTDSVLCGTGSGRVLPRRESRYDRPGPEQVTQRANRAELLIPNPSQCDVLRRCLFKPFQSLFMTPQSKIESSCSANGFISARCADCLPGTRRSRGLDYGEGLQCCPWESQTLTLLYTVSV